MGAWTSSGKRARLGTRQVLGRLGYSLSPHIRGAARGCSKQLLAGEGGGRQPPCDPRSAHRAEGTVRGEHGHGANRGGQGHARRGGGRWAHTAHDAPPSFLALVRLQVTGERVRKALRGSDSSEWPHRPPTLGSPWGLEADGGGVSGGGLALVGQQAEAGRRVSRVPRAPPPVGPAPALGAG